MDSKGMEENGMRKRSFRCEDYNNRRVFLRSYPLHWEGEDKENDEETVVTKRNTKKKPIKKIILSMFHWGEGKVLVLRRFKHKFTIYIIACIPVGFKSPTALISA
ncbi:1,3-beta-glucan synthase component bgs4 [Melia azedarach]|uniref:1,3-beta-glucan synthase component bgs4 n=1 Tax=Melia azedarach TaxID=155640 RepID=A0ACC1XIB0_MELAZ|nr:1,3-beta-glucan synthase component bgs4 [Melia azedarach]